MKFASLLILLIFSSFAPSELFASSEDCEFLKQLAATPQAGRKVPHRDMCCDLDPQNRPGVAGIVYGVTELEPDLEWTFLVRGDTCAENDVCEDGCDGKYLPMDCVKFHKCKKGCSKGRCL